MKRHPDDEALLAYCVEERTEEAVSSVSAHLEKGCARCIGRVEAYRAILARLQFPALEDVPEEWLQMATKRIRELEEKSAPIGERVRRSIDSSVRKAAKKLDEIRMGLAFDSALATATPGIRGVRSLEGRQLLFESELGKLHLEIRKVSSGKVELSGQFLPADGSEVHGARALLERGERVTRRKVSGTGEFAFPSITTGKVTIRLVWQEKHLVAESIDLSPGSDS
jgi:hypothetical protein